MIGVLLAMTCAMMMTDEGRADMLQPDDIQVNGWELTIRSADQSLTIQPLALRSHTHTAALEAGTPGWRGPLLLPGSAWAYRALRVDSLVVTLTDDPKVTLTAGKDFLLDADWGAVALPINGPYPAGTRVTMRYQYGLSRLDLIERSPDGRITVKQGREDKSQPTLPDVTPGYTPLASVYLPNHADGLTMAMINLIDPTDDGKPPVHRPQRIAPILKRLAAGEPTTIVFFGDSITNQGHEDFRDGKGSFVDRFVAHLRSAYPDHQVMVTPRDKPVEPKPSQVVIVKAGVGGDDTTRGLRRMDDDVLAHQPHLVVIMFGINDENRRMNTDRNVVLPDEYAKNLTTMAQRIREAGGEPLIMTTGMKNPGWISTIGNLHEYAARARQVAAEHDLCLIDNYDAWQRLPKRGYNFMIALGNCINHPVDLGHKIFAGGLIELFTPQSQH